MKGVDNNIYVFEMECCVMTRYPMFIQGFVAPLSVSWLVAHALHLKNGMDSKFEWTMQDAFLLTITIVFEMIYYWQMKHWPFQCTDSAEYTLIIRR